LRFPRGFNRCRTFGPEDGFDRGYVPAHGLGSTTAVFDGFCGSMPVAAPARRAPRRYEQTHNTRRNSPSGAHPDLHVRPHRPSENHRPLHRTADVVRIDRVTVDVDGIVHSKPGIGEVRQGDLLSPHRA
jgi:hypothetical protein